MNSVNTNVGAMVALQNLNSTNAELTTTQSRINTGKKIASARDNGAVWAIAQNQRAASNALNSVRESLQRGQTTVEVAISAGESVSDLLLQMKEKALAAADAGLDTTSRAALADEFASLKSQITKAVSNAEFNGGNMLKQAGTTVQSLANSDASSRITVAAQTLTVSALSINASTIGRPAAGPSAIATAIARLSSMTGDGCIANNAEYSAQICRQSVDSAVCASA